MASLPLFILASGGSFKYVQDAMPASGEALQALVALVVLTLAVVGLIWRQREEMSEARDEGRLVGRTERIDFLLSAMGGVRITAGGK